MSAPAPTSVEAVLLGEDGGAHERELVGVVGESHYQAAISAACGRRGSEAVRHECVAALVAEPGNQYDPNAVMVQVDGRPVGYLSREDAILYHPVIDAATRLGVVVACNAFISARDGGEATTTNAGVFLHIPSPEDSAVELAEWSRQKLGDGR